MGLWFKYVIVFSHYNIRNLINVVTKICGDIALFRIEKNTQSY